MKDYIERQAAVEKVYRLKTRIARRRYVGITDEVIDMLDDLVGDIDDIPTVEIAIPVKQITDAIVDKYGEMAMPSADAVEVVRCKDCIHNYMKSWNQGKIDYPRCRFTDYRRSNEFYCGFGERADK